MHHLQDFGHFVVKEELSVLEHLNEIANTWIFINSLSNFEKNNSILRKHLKTRQSYREKNGNVKLTN